MSFQISLFETREQVINNRIAKLQETNECYKILNADELTKGLKHFVSGGRVYSWGKMIMQKNGQTKKDFEEQIKHDYKAFKIKWITIK